MPDVNTDILKVLKERHILAYTKEKHLSSAASIEADMQKGILKEGNAGTNIYCPMHLFRSILLMKTV